ncbi:MAG: hypothetical protein E4H01_08685 [Lysobacterales bacterium]|nr:MAG: hypothetical protein E4H01_08685 [Xanthomonadales bacterium]
MQFYYYLLWILLLAPLVWYGWRAVLRPEQIFAPPFFVCFGVNFLYVFGYLSAPAEMNLWFMAPDAYLLLLILCVLSVYAFIFGHALGHRRRIPESIYTSQHKQIPLTYCFAVLAVAYAGLVYFIAVSGGPLKYYSAVHGTAGAWEETTAYIHALPNFMFPMVFVLFARRRFGLARNPFEGIALWLTLSVLAFQAILFGNRGDMIRFVLIFGISLVYIGNWRPSRLKLLLPISAAFAAVLIFPFVREALYLGAKQDLGKAVIEATEGIASSTNSSDERVRFRREETGNNLYLSAAMIKATNENLDIDYGFGWLSIPVGFVPRAFWPEKHEVMARWFKNDLAVAENAVKKWRVINGASPGGISDAFIRFWWFAPLIWLLFGYWGGRLRKKAQHEPTIFSVGYFIAYMIGLTYWVTQNAQAMFSGWFFFVIPLLVAALVPAPHRTKPRTSMKTETRKKLQS